MPYFPDPTLITQPSSSVDASTAAEEFRNIKKTIYGGVNVTVHDAVGDGVTDNQAALDAAIAKVKALSPVAGGTIILPPGAFKLSGAVSAGGDSRKNGIHLPFTAAPLTSEVGRIIIRGHGRSTVLLPGSANQYIVRMSDSECALVDLVLDGNSISGVTGVGIVPADTAPAARPATPLPAMFNHLLNVEIRNCAEGMEYMSAPRALDGFDSETRNNNAYNLNILQCTRGRWFRSAPFFVGIPSASPNRNKTFGARIGQGVNTGTQIDSGAQNEDYGVEYEGIDTGISPNATPTALKIATVDANGWSVANNKFFGGSCEEATCTRHIENAGVATEFHGFTHNGAKSVYTQVPLIILGGNDPSFVPQVFPGYVYQTNNMIPGFNPGVPYLGTTLAAGVALAGVRNLAKIFLTGPGGTPSAFEFFAPYSEGVSDYLITRGAYDAAGTSYARRISIFTETSSGTFVESARLADYAVGSAVFATDLVQRLVFGSITCTVLVTKAATSFTNFATMQRLG